MKNNIRTNFATDVKFKNFAKEEAIQLIEIIPEKILRKFFKEHHKLFNKTSDGFRPDKIDKKNLLNFYYDTIYLPQFKNVIITQAVDSQLCKISREEIDPKINEKFGEILKLKESIEKNEKKIFENFIDFLQDTPFRGKERIYFKFIEFELNDEQKKYLDKYEKEKLKKEIIKVEKIKIEDELQKKFKTEINNLRQVKDEEIKRFQIDNNKLVTEINKLADENIKLKDKIQLINKENEQEITRYNIEIEVEKGKNDALLKKMNLQYDEKKQYFEDIFKQENRKLFDEIESNKKQIAKLKIEENELVKKNISLSLDYDDLQKQYEYLSDKSEGYISSLTSILNRFGQNKGNKLIEFYYEDGVKYDDEFNIEKTQDLIDELKLNLKLLIKDKYDEVAKSIISVLPNRRLLLCSKANAMVTKIISRTVFSENPLYITLPIGYNDICELTRFIENRSEKVIVFQDCIDNVSDTVFYPLLRKYSNIKDKVIMFTLESKHNNRLISSGLWNYITPIYFDNIIEFNELEYDIDKKINNCYCNFELLEELKVSRNKTIKWRTKKIFEEINKYIEQSVNSITDISDFLALICEMNNNDTTKDFIPYFISPFITNEKTQLDIYDYMKEQKINDLIKYNSLHL